MSKTIKEYAAELNARNEELEALKKENDELKNKTFHMERKIDTLRNIIRNTRDDNDELKEAIAKKNEEHDILERKCNNLREILSSLCVATDDAKDVRAAIDTEDWDFVRNAIHEYANYWFDKTDKVKAIERRYTNVRDILTTMCVAPEHCDDTKQAIEEEDWNYVKEVVYRRIESFKNTEYIKELEEKYKDKCRDYESVKQLCRNLSDQNKEAQETVNKQRDMLTYWHTFTLNHLKWPIYAVDKVEQGYYAEARTSLDAKGFVLFAKYENLKKFVCNNCVVAADMDETKAALEAEDWDRARARIANYMHVHAEAENSIKDNYFKKELDAKDAENEKLKKDYEALKRSQWLQTCELSAQKQENERLKRDLIDAVDCREDFRKENKELEIKFKHCSDKLTRLRNFMLDNLNYTGSIVQKIELGRFVDAITEIATNYDPKTTLNKIYGAGGDLDGDVIMLPGCKVSFNAKAGCYTFDIGGQHIVATNGGHIFIDKE